ncbi:hypothetical protein NDU88_000503 [Pleurodeles waltl]|uniref:Uncharacterized protein n=1 Tax=Pleurodeles waltl TaxID=8319 RepID=A0AAV7L8B5_PLEWA|nr:hypothetical protein NDU88_000503 [Pleurodeles waltl]
MHLIITLLADVYVITFTCHTKCEEEGPPKCNVKNLDKELELIAEEGEERKTKPTEKKDLGAGWVKAGESRRKLKEELQQERHRQNSLRRASRRMEKRVFRPDMCPAAALSVHARQKILPATLLEGRGYSRRVPVQTFDMRQEKEREEVFLNLVIKGGHTLSAEGVVPKKSLVDGIIKAPAPDNKENLLSFAGSWSVVACFYEILRQRWSLLQNLQEEIPILSRQATKSFRSN